MSRVINFQSFWNRVLNPAAFRGDFSAPSKNQFFWIFETLNVSYSGLNQPILTCNTSFPLKIKCSFIWNRFQPGKKSSGKIPGKIRFFGFLKFLLLGASLKRGQIIYFWTPRTQADPKNNKFLAVEIFGVFKSTVIILCDFIK